MKNEILTRKEIIDNRLKQAGWNVTDPTQVVEEFDIQVTIVEEPIVPYGRHQYSDYVLLGKDGKPLAVVEAKKTSVDAAIGREQAKQYCFNIKQTQGVDLPFCFYTNGHDIYFWNLDNYPPKKVYGFPTRDDLERYAYIRKARKQLAGELINTKIAGRNYQVASIRAVMEAVEKRKRKFLLVMATGTGKTRTCISLVDALMRAGWAERVLFLVDRIALRDQTLDAFKEHLPNEPRWPKQGEKEITTDRRIYISTYPTMLNVIRNEEKSLSPHFFDLIVVDESHRSIYNTYQEILDYFNTITLGLTATPTDVIDHNTFQLFECEDGIPTFAYSYDEAVNHIPRLIFLTNHSARHPKEQNLIAKAQEVVARKKFSTIDELKSAVYAALVNYLLEKEIVRSGPFDAAHAEKATYTDIDPARVKQFVRLAQSRRGFPLNETEPIENIITHLNLGLDRKLTNASILLFGKEPQRFFINSEVRCASFSGTEVEKPIPSYKVFKGTVFELADQALEFVLNKLNYRIETRSEQISIPGSYEIPKEALSEAIVNAIAHRDYTSNASVQVMVFRDRVEIWNPGSLPMGWTTQKLKQLHTSVPANPLLAEPLYLAGYIERLGTGTTDIVKKCLASGLQEPQFIQAEDFKTILYRPSTDQVREQVEEQVREQVEEQVREQVRELVLTIQNEMSAQEIMNVMNLKGRRNFLQNYLQPAIGDAFIEMSQPDSPKSPTQKYRLTARGKALKQQLKTKK